MSERTPIRPEGHDEFVAVMNVTCLHCHHGKSPAGCVILVAMLRHSADVAPWPEGGWTTDPGAEVTCLSYEPRRDRPVLSRQQVRRLGRMSEAARPPMCGGCAAQKGSEASCALHTRRDFAASVEGPSIFMCHERPGYCGGWVNAVLAKAKKREVQSV